MKTILSIDGGGVRGIIPAKILAHIEKSLNAPLHQVFDLMVGTSTGAILTATLNTPKRVQPTTDQQFLFKRVTHAKEYYTANDLVDFYKIHSQHIFDDSLTSLMSSGFGFLSATYSHQSFEQILDAYLHKTTLSQTFTQLLIPCFDLANNRIFLFDSNNQDQANAKLSTIIRSATAAPTFFLPELYTNHNNVHCLMDGAVYVNNPAMVALTYAKKTFPEEKDFLLISLGTGKHHQSHSYEEASQWGKTEWIRPLLRAMSTGHIQNTHEQLCIFLKENYIRLGPTLFSSDYHLDNASPENIANLEADAEYFIETHQTKLNHTIERLNQHLAAKARSEVYEKGNQFEPQVQPLKTQDTLLPDHKLPLSSNNAPYQI